MKKSILLIAWVFVSCVLMAQAPVKFLGIPVDGSKSDMIEQIKKKGYTYHPLGDNDYLEGEFNGQTVHVYVHTNKNKVDRVMVASQFLCNETQIINEFNVLLHDFENSDRYFPTLHHVNEYIDKKENISYEMRVHNKEYRALFYQSMTKEDAAKMKSEVSDNFEAVCSVLKSNIENNIDKMGEYKDALSFLYDDSMSKEEKVNKIALFNVVSFMTSNLVWFRIAEYYGQYYMVIYYDNVNNRPKGEDL